MKGKFGKEENRYRHTVKNFTKGIDITNKRRAQFIVQNYRTSKIKKKYSKICLQEGVKSDRVHLGGKISGLHEGISNDEEKTTDNKPKDKYKVKLNPFRKDIEIAQQKINADLLRISKENERANAIENSKAIREKKRKIFKQKTRKGQPIMNNRIQLLLAKISNTK